MQNTNIQSNENDISTIAQYTGSRAIAVKNFITANNLDAARLANDLSKDQKTERKNFASAINGKARLEYLNQLKNKYSLNESAESLSFWQSEHGQEILDMVKDDKLDEVLVKRYLTSLIENGDQEKPHVLNQIAYQININPSHFDLFTQQIDAMIKRLKQEYEIYLVAPLITKGKIDEVVDKVLGVHFDQKIQNTSNTRRYIITLAQFQTLLPQIIKSRKAKYNI